MKDIELPPLSKFDHPEPRTMQWSDLELYAIKSYARAAVEADRAQRVPDYAISGALFDFAGFLTTLDVPARFGSTEEASPMVELLQGFAKKRGLSLDNADVLHWSTMLASTPAQPAQQEPNWWRKRADEIEVTVARSGSTEAMRCFTDMRTLLQAATAHQEPPQQERKPMTKEKCKTCEDVGGWEVTTFSTSYFWQKCPDCGRHHGIKE